MEYSIYLALDRILSFPADHVFLNDIQHHPKKMVVYSMVALIITITLPMVGLINSIDRPMEQTEWNHLLSQLKSGALWAYYSIAGHLYLIGWLAALLWKLLAQKNKTSTQS